MPCTRLFIAGPSYSCWPPLAHGQCFLFAQHMNKFVVRPEPFVVVCLLLRYWPLLQRRC